MKLNRPAWFIRNEGETIAMFGDARLVKTLSGKIELIGGSLEDRADAREWCSLFMHEAVITMDSASRTSSPPLVLGSFCLAKSPPHCLPLDDFQVQAGTGMWLDSSASKSSKGTNNERQANAPHLP